MNKPDEPDDLGGNHATIDEVADALRALTDVDYRNLMRSARIRAYGMTGQTAEDLLHTAIGRLMAGQRKWKRGVPFLAVIRGTLRSLAMDWWRGVETAKVLPEADLAFQADEDEDDVQLGVIDRAADAYPDAEQQLIARQELEAVKAAFQDDKMTWEIALALANGDSPETIRYAYDLTETQYDSALKRIWRLKRTLSPGGGK
ncbi:MAG TPA: hypothetical protein VD995_32540 [Azospirillum sp.]|nr:hypothetical protein [Azospirillum sp.]